MIFILIRKCKQARRPKPTKKGEEEEEEEDKEEQ
jgi:hypothetical protein